MFGYQIMLIDFICAVEIAELFAVDVFNHIYQMMPLPRLVKLDFLRQQVVFEVFQKKV